MNYPESIRQKRRMVSRFRNHRQWAPTWERSSRGLRRAWWEYRRLLYFRHVRGLFVFVLLAQYVPANAPAMDRGRVGFLTSRLNSPPPLLLLLLLLEMKRFAFPCNRPIHRDDGWKPFSCVVQSQFSWKIKCEWQYICSCSIYAITI